MTMSAFLAKKKGGFILREVWLIVWGVIGGLVGWVTGGFDVGLKILIAAMVIDYLSGCIASAIEGKKGRAKGLSSKIGYKGILRKMLIILVVSAGHLTDLFLGNGGMFRGVAIALFFANEILSLFENAGRIGIPIPEQWKEAVEVLKRKKGE